MKKLFSTFLFFFGIIGLTFSQGDFAPIGAEWHYKYADNGSINSGYTFEKSIKDTIINGKQCRQIERMRYSRNIYTPNNTTIDTAGPFYKYFYSNPDTVFYYNYGLDTFLPLYIFNVNVGDTMVYHVPNIDTTFYPDTFFRLVVTNITDTTINGKTLRTIHNESIDGWGFDGAESHNYTELIGCQSGYPEHHFGYYTLESFSPYVRCYSDSSIVFQPNVFTPCDYIPPAYSSIGGIAPKDLGITLFPNPATDYFKLEKLSTIIEIKEITIKDITGRVIKNLKPTSTNQYHITDLTAGMYIVEIATQDGIGYLKLYKN